MAKLFNYEEEKFLRNNFFKRDTKTLTNMFNEKFNRNITAIQMRNWKKHNHLKNGLRKIFNDEEIEFLKIIIKGKTLEEVVEIFNKKFNKNITTKQVRNFKETYKIKSGIDTKFKKGNIPHNIRKNGSEFISKNDGRTFVKIDNKKWQLKNRYLYEKNKGLIPKDYVVIFLDGNKENFNINNLKLIKRKDLLTLKNKQLIFKNKELTETGIMIAKLINKTSERKILCRLK